MRVAVMQVLLGIGAGTPGPGDANSADQSEGCFDRGEYVVSLLLQL
jgi:hypothetical protein